MNRPNLPTQGSDPMKDLTQSDTNAQTSPPEQRTRALAADMLAARQAGNTAEYNRLMAGLTPDDRRQLIDLLAGELIDRALDGLLGQPATGTPTGGDQ